MKTHLAFILMFCPLSCFSQLNYKHNAIRSGDEIVKQQIEYKDPGRSGENVIWNFGKLTAVDLEYKLSYVTPKLRRDSIYILGKDTILQKTVKSDELVVGLEHGTKYYYEVKNKGLYILGYENYTTLSHYDEPLQILTYPINYGDGFSNSYSSKAKYSNRVDFYTKGDITVIADARGKMILPTGDTLSNVIRVKTTQSFLEPDSVVYKNEQQLNMLVDNYKWYSQGYRYPVFETIHTVNMQGDEKADYYTTAFFYPPQEHYYLSNDLDNIAILDSLWNEEYNIKEPIIPGDPMSQGGDFTYNYYPNPIERNLHVEYLLEKRSNVIISIFDMNGKLLKELIQRDQDVGMYSETIDCLSLSNGNYVLRLAVDEKVINEKIMKK